MDAQFDAEPEPDLNINPGGRVVITVKMKGYTGEEELFITGFGYPFKRSLQLVTAGNGEGMVSISLKKFNKYYFSLNRGKSRLECCVFSVEDYNEEFWMG